MITIIVVGLLNAMRVERSAANSHLEKARATLYAQQGVEDVVATLNNVAGDPNRNWISQPGQLIANVTPTLSSGSNGTPTPTPSKSLHN